MDKICLLKENDFKRLVVLIVYIDFLKIISQENFINKKMDVLCLNLVYGIELYFFISRREKYGQSFVKSK